jgi:hypothetical protein
MNIAKLACAALFLIVASSVAISTIANAQPYYRRDGDRYNRNYDGGYDQPGVRFHNPKVDGLVLDGCYRFPGRCNSEREANEFCRRRGFDGATDWHAENRGGLFTTMRLGDGGRCFASCTVMTFVACE